MADYRTEVLADSPFAYYEFPNSGSVWKNSVNSTTYTLTNVGGGPAVGAAGPKGGLAVNFDGVDDYLQGASFPDFVNGTFSFECWVKYATQSMDYPTFVRRDGGGGAWLVRTRGAATGSRIYELESYTNGETVQSTPTTYNDSAWHHVVFVSSGFTGTLYVDNVAKTTRTGAQTAITMGTAAPTFIGRGSGATEFYSGYMAQVAFYTTALSAARVSAHYNATNIGSTTGYRGWGVPL